MKERASIEPSDLLAALPFSISSVSFLGYVSPLAMLLSTLPVTDVLSSIGPSESALALSLVISEFTFIALAIFPGKYT